MGRAIEEQEDEIRELEGRMKRLRGVMGELGRRAGAGKEEVDVDGDGGEIGVMEGVEQA